MGKGRHVFVSGLSDGMTNYELLFNNSYFMSLKGKNPMKGYGDTSKAPAIVPLTLLVDLNTILR